MRDSVEFAAYLFYRYAADHPVILSDPHLVDSRGRGDRALDSWGEVRTPEAMAAMAARFRERWGFRVFKLKGGVLAPEVERDTLKAMAARWVARPCCGSTPTDAGRPRRRSGSARRSRNSRWNTTKTRCKVRRRWPRSAARPA